MDFGGPWDLKKHDFAREGHRKSRFSCLAGGQPNRAQNGSKMSLKSTPKRTPEDQNEAPKRYWISDSILASILSRLGGPKGLPKGTQNRSKIALGAPGTPKRRPGSLQAPPGGLQEAILASFWDPRELIFEPFSEASRSLRSFQKPQKS